MSGGRTDGPRSFAVRTAAANCSASGCRDAVLPGLFDLLDPLRLGGTPLALGLRMLGHRASIRAVPGFGVGAQIVRALEQRRAEPAAALGRGDPAESARTCRPGSASRAPIRTRLVGHSSAVDDGEARTRQRLTGSGRLPEPRTEADTPPMPAARDAGSAPLPQDADLGAPTGFRSVAATVLAYAVAMAFMEAAVVVYLQRALGLDPQSLFPLRDANVLGDLGAIEVGREAATLVMLGAVGWLAGRSGLERLAWAAVAFGTWDVGYYAFAVGVHRLAVVARHVGPAVPYPRSLDRAGLGARRHQPGARRVRPGRRPAAPRRQVTPCRSGTGRGGDRGRAGGRPELHPGGRPRARRRDPDGFRVAGLRRRPCPRRLGCDNRDPLAVGAGDG